MPSLSGPTKGTDHSSYAHVYFTGCTFLFCPLKGHNDPRPRQYDIRTAFNNTSGSQNAPAMVVGTKLLFMQIHVLSTESESNYMRVRGHGVLWLFRKMHFSYRLVAR